MVVGYSPRNAGLPLDTCSLDDDFEDFDRMRVTVVSCDKNVVRLIETLSVGEARRFFLLELDLARFALAKTTAI